jgi:folate-binding protein YgfZ
VSNTVNENLNEKLNDNIIACEIEHLVCVVTGADAGKYLHSQLSNDIASLTVGASRYSFVLEPMGKVIALVRVTRTEEETFVLDTEDVDGLGDQLLARLNRFKIRVKADIAVSTEKYVTLRSRNGTAIEQAGFAVSQWGSGAVIDAPSASLDASTVAGFIQVSAAEFDALRIRSGWPAMGREIIAGETLPAATGVVSIAVSFTKGCYPGQELVERMDSRGSTAPKNLRLLTGSIVDNAKTGEAVIVAGEAVGEFTSVADGCALAYVARAVELGVVVDATKFVDS